MEYKELLTIAGLILAMWSFVALGSALDTNKITLSEQTEEVSAEIIDTDITEHNDGHQIVYDIEYTYKYEYNNKEYTTEFSTRYSQPTTNVRLSNDEYYTNNFSESLESRTTNMEGSEEFLYINSENPSDAQRFSTDSFVSGLAWGIGVLIWIPVSVWFCHSFVRDIICR